MAETKTIESFGEEKEKKPLVKNYFEYFAKLEQEFLSPHITFEGLRKIYDLKLYSPFFDIDVDPKKDELTSGEKQTIKEAFSAMEKKFLKIFEQAKLKEK